MTNEAATDGSSVTRGSGQWWVEKFRGAKASLNGEEGYVTAQLKYLEDKYSNPKDAGVLLMLLMMTVMTGETQIQDDKVSVKSAQLGAISVVTNLISNVESDFTNQGTPGASEANNPGWQKFKGGLVNGKYTEGDQAKLWGYLQELSGIPGGGILSKAQVSSIMNDMKFFSPGEMGSGKTGYTKFHTPFDNLTPPPPPAGTKPTPPDPTQFQSDLQGLTSAGTSVASVSSATKTQLSMVSDQEQKGLALFQDIVSDFCKQIQLMIQNSCKGY